MTLQKKDFVEVEFTGKTSDGEVFDSNVKEELDKANLSIQAKPFVFCLGEGMFLEGIDNFLIGKEVGNHKIKLSPENAFGKRNAKLIQMIPLKIFREHKTQVPVPGLMFQFDGKVGKVLTVSGGRVVVDFNNPLAGKDVEYAIDVKRKVEDINEKIKSFNDFFFRRNFEFEIKDKKLTLKVDKGYKQFVELFKDKFKEILDLDMEAVEPEDSDSGKKQQ